jgi:LysR family transcriptional regulator, hca operon transcriptional activator
MSQISSTGGVALLPAYARTFLPREVSTRPLRGFTPKIDLSVGYRKANASPILKLFLSRLVKLARIYRTPKLHA